MRPYKPFLYFSSRTAIRSSTLGCIMSSREIAKTGTETSMLPALVKL